MIKLTIPGDAVSKQSFRVAFKNGKMFKYKDEDVKTQEKFIGVIAREIYNHKPLENPLSMQVIVYRSMPKYIWDSKKKRAMALNKQLLPITRPDFDNITKLLGDALEKIIYRNDSLICKYSFEKYYAEIPRTEIIIKEIK